MIMLIKINDSDFVFQVRKTRNRIYYLRKPELKQVSL